jgi:hypothetical protein
MADTLSQLKELIEIVMKLKSEGRNWESTLDSGLAKITRSAAGLESGFDSLSRTMDGFSKISIQGSDSLNQILFRNI